MAQTAVDLMDEYLGMKDGPERAFSQTLQDRRDESIGEAESSLVDRLFKSVQEAFKSDEEPEELSWAERVGLNEALSPAQRAERERLQKEFDKLPRKNKIIEEITEVITESPAGAVALDETMQLPPAIGSIEDLQGDPNSWQGIPITDGTSFLSPEDWGNSWQDMPIEGGSSFLSPEDWGDTWQDMPIPTTDKTTQLPSAMELAQMGLGYSSGLNKPTPELLEGLGTMIDAAKAEGGQLSKYEQMLLLASLGIPAAALSGRAAGALLSKLGIGSKLRSPKLGRGPSAMRDMGPQAGNITGGAIALEKLGRPIPGRIKSSFDKILGEGAVPSAGNLGRPIPGRSGPAAQRILGGGNLTAGSTGLASLKKFMGKESLRRPQVSKMAGAKFVDPNHKKVFTRAFGGPKDNTMYMYSDDAFDVFKDTITRKTFKVPNTAGKVDKIGPPRF